MAAAVVVVVVEQQQQQQQQQRQQLRAIAWVVFTDWHFHLAACGARHCRFRLKPLQVQARSCQELAESRHIAEAVDRVSCASPYRYSQRQRDPVRTLQTGHA